MDWKTLLCDKRLGGEIKIPYDQTQFSMSEFEKDYWRIIDCSAFRRLQDKTQVFPLDRSDFVRTRLTHSLEVSALAKQLVAMVYKNISQKTRREIREKYPFAAEEAQHAGVVAACAGLLHDIGNPPFGHFGEDVMHAWFENHLTELAYKDGETKQKVSLSTQEIVEDLKHFEGNAQAFRLLTKLHSVDSEAGLNLTAAVLNVIVKYPTDSRHIDANAENVCVHKLGYYHTDRETFEWVARSTGTFFEDEHHRHPLTFILEAADDIAYATADLEDSYKKGLFTLDQFAEFFEEELEMDQTPDKNKYSKVLMKDLQKFRDSADTEMKAFQQWINHTRHWLLYCAAFGFAKNYSEIMAGRFHGEIICDTFHERTMEILKKAMVRFTFCSPEILKLELSAEAIIEGLMERFVPAAIDWSVPSESRTTKRKAEKKLMTLVSENHKEAYTRYKTENKEYNLYLRLILVADYISGMTDTYAKTMYQELSGI